MGLTRKKITVKSKKGKTYQRSVMVKAVKETAHREKNMKSLTTAGNREPSQAQKMLAKVTGIFSRKKQAGVLHAMHPWEEHHLGPDTGSKLGIRSQQNDKYMPGPGSDHSWHALRLGAYRQDVKPRQEKLEASHDQFKHQLSAVVGGMSRNKPSEHLAYTTRFGRLPEASDYDFRTKKSDLTAAFGEDVEHMRHNPFKWVR